MNKRASEFQRQSDIFQSSGMARADAQMAAATNVMIDQIVGDHSAHLAEKYAPERELEAPKKKSRAQRERDEIRARDGDACWLCGEFVSTEDESTEHLVPVSRGGSESLDNKALCHASCNRELGNLPLESKLALREQRRAQNGNHAGHDLTLVEGK